jgi:cold shock CspA family protein
MTKTGIVWRLLIGCGFIHADDDPDRNIFFAARDVVDHRFAALYQGARVSFVLVPNLRRPGELQARIVRPVDSRYVKHT